MPKTFSPAASEVAELIRTAMDQGRTVRLSLVGAKPRVTAPESPIAMGFRLLLGLTSAEARALVTLMENDPVATMEALHAAIAQNDDPETDIELVRVLIHKLRKKLDTHGVEVDTLRGSGYRLTAKNRDKLRKLLTEATNAEAAPST